MPESTLYINGAWVASSDGEVREIRSPHDNSVVSIVSEATAADTRDAIKAARESFDSGVYASWSMKDRCALVEKVADLTIEQLESTLPALQLDGQRCRAHALIPTTQRKRNTVSDDRARL
jgi:acyl-CoA reductase-like NAD-dependent aldehyde dehydrogenase